MKTCFVAGLDERSMYLRFIRYMMKKSSKFSVVYFRYNTGEKLKKTVREMKDRMAPYKILEKNVCE